VRAGRARGGVAGGRCGRPGRTPPSGPGRHPRPRSGQGDDRPAHAPGRRAPDRGAGGRGRTVVSGPRRGHHPDPQGGGTVRVRGFLSDVRDAVARQGKVDLAGQGEERQVAKLRAENDLLRSVLLRVNEGYWYVPPDGDGEKGVYVKVTDTGTFMSLMSAEEQLLVYGEIVAPIKEAER